jgi:phospholipid N-methyltransferase
MFPTSAATAQAVDLLAELCPSGGRVLEMGVGTGRIAIPLAERGLRVRGVEASTRMLAKLAEKDPDRRVTPVANPSATANELRERHHRALGGRYASSAVKKTSRNVASGQGRTGHRVLEVGLVVVSRAAQPRFEAASGASCHIS